MNTPLRRAGRLLVAVAVIALMAPVIPASAAAPVRSIVIFEDHVLNAAAMEHIERLGGVQIKELPLVGGAVVLLPSRAAEHAVHWIDGVERVEPDARVQALAKPAPVQPAQVVPWGITRIGAASLALTGDPVKVAVVDTGISRTHPDLVDNIKGGVSTVGYTTNYDDDNGHGSHVAGIIGAVNNSIGVVGVAPAADLYGVKVLDRRGSGYVSDIIEGLSWAIDNNMDVVNMSLGTSTYVASFDVAVQQAIAAGVVVVAAAGNSGSGSDTVNYPAKFAGVIAVSATDSNNTLASFSSRGPSVDLAAPGVSVYSAYKKGSYATLSGTSMASPHVAGAAALVLTSPIGTDDLDADGAWDPVEVERRLERTAQDLGASGFDSSYGVGLVRADLAVAP